MSIPQRRAVREFLLLFKEHPDYKHDRPEIENAIATYWKE
jgi:hypothetical protein